MLTVFLNQQRCVILDLLPQSTSFAAGHFAAQLTFLTRPRHEQARCPARRKLQLHFHEPRCHTAVAAAREKANRPCTRFPHPPYSLYPAICDFWPFGRRHKELQGLTIVGEDHLLE
jgi:hypothetical protein